MPINHSGSSDFPTSYTAARERFLKFAKEAGAELASVRHPQTGPDGENLFMDFASIGNPDADAALVIVSGTHGIEGFCGSDVQSRILGNIDGLLGRLSNTRLILLHAHNPYGFAWLRRVNEDNVDLNRNYVDFSEPQEMNEEYIGVKDLVLPLLFDDKSDKAMADWIKENGLDQYQKVVMGGQRVDPNGLFYGATEAAWSNKIVHEMLPKFTAKQKYVGLIDIHTGLGPFGHGDLIHAYAKGSREYQDLRDWYGDEMIGINAGEYGDIVAAVPRGPIVSSLDLILPDKQSYGFVVEYGTVEFDRVLRVLSMDNWLHVHGDLKSSRAQEIKEEMRACFYSETNEWRQLIWDRAVWSIDKLASGLAAASA